jgi:hypothetical protein
MNDVPIQIRNPDVVRAIRELAAEKGQPITEAVGDVVRAELCRLAATRETQVQQRMEAARRIVDEFNALPVLGAVPTDDDFYDKDGFPK